MDFECLRFDVDCKVVTVRLDRPKVNAQNTLLREEVIRAFDLINDMDEVRVAILTGAGSCFSAGAPARRRTPSVSASSR
jgi:enoyl-CoA hydratase